MRTHRQNRISVSLAPRAAGASDLQQDTRLKAHRRQDSGLLHGCRHLVYACPGCVSSCYGGMGEVSACLQKKGSVGRLEESMPLYVR